MLHQLPKTVALWSSDQLKGAWNDWSTGIARLQLELDERGLDKERDADGSFFRR